VALRRKKFVLFAAAVSCVSLAACGSALSPQEAQLANGTTQIDGTGNGGQGGTSNEGTSGGGVGSVGGTTGGTKTTKSPSGGTGTSGGVAAGGTGGTSGGTGGGTSGGGTSGGGTSGGGGVAAGNCAGFKNDKGITDKQITIGQVADISGPVPGLFKSTQDATKAFVAYFNSTVGGICGRTLNLVTEDSRTDDGGDQAAAIDACTKAFALVGSMSAFDGGGAATATACGLPDLRVAATNAPRYRAPNSFGVYSLAPNLIPEAEPNSFKRLFPGVQDSAAFIYLNAGSAASNGKSFKAAYTKAGFNFVYEQGVDVTELSYDTYVNAMHDKKVKYIQYTGAYQNGIKLARSIAAKKASDPSWQPIYVMDSVAYDPNFPAAGGAAVDGVVSFTSSGLFEAPTPELTLYTQWLQRVSPGSQPTFFGQYAWSAARLFTETALKLGGKLNRQTLLAAVAAIHAWTGHGMHAASDIGGKKTPACTAILQLKGGRWVNIGGGNPYVCGGLIDSGIGA
jgi:hypothetical protein